MYIANVMADSTSKFINDNNLASGEFQWQESSSAFSVSKKDVSIVCNYILNQEEHHKKVTSKEEYERFIKFYEKTIRPSK